MQSILQNRALHSYIHDLLVISLGFSVWVGRTVWPMTPQPQGWALHWSGMYVPWVIGFGCYPPRLVPAIPSGVGSRTPTREG